MEPRHNDAAMRFLSSRRPSIEETAAAIGGSSGGFERELFAAADQLREKALGRRISFVVNRNINFTNVCAINCLFCGYSVRPGDKISFILDDDEILSKIRASVPLGITEVCITGGLHPELSLDRLTGMVRAISTGFPGIHIHAFSPMEIVFLSRKEGLTAREIIARLMDAGLGSMPGTAAEILVDDVRNKICPGKLSTAEWIDVIRTAHTLGLRTTATMMFGHVESERDMAEHLGILRSIQEETGGFSEFVPLPFIPFKTALKNVPARSLEASLVKRVHAVARVFFEGLIPNIQVSWTKLGVQAARDMLHAGVSDLGGTLVEENITRMAGGTHGQYLSRGEMAQIIREEGFEPVERDTLYAILTPA
jgi:7,8-didemethyl-8-hydroxy-5-deazariboflavin synthase CofH subunit